ncbi:hypothetical protein VTL71DRAFT_9468 [Oculimacula yallundae]|uniref:Uncharacterized protein n=1 Tax=Oculimacula yallundae TaxID=86028 RepID=A0ABR4BSU0_9HELO
MGLHRERYKGKVFTDQYRENFF